MERGDDRPRPRSRHIRARPLVRVTRAKMDMVASFADNVGVPVPALIPLALVAVAALVFVLDGLSHVVLKPFKSPPVIATLPVVGGMMAFLKGPIGLMANAMPKYGEVFTGASRFAVGTRGEATPATFPSPWLSKILDGDLPPLPIALSRSRLAARAYSPSHRAVPRAESLVPSGESPDTSYPSPPRRFAVPVFHKRITFLIGPKVSEHFFKAKDTEMSQKEVYEFNVPTFGKGVVFDVDHQTRAEQFRFFADSLKSNRLRQYVGMMVKEAEDFFSKWGDEGEVNLLEALSELIVLTASRCLLGREIRETLFSEVTQLVHDLDKGMVPLSVFFPYAPIEEHRKRDKARKELAAIFDKVIQARRASGAVEPDVLQTFIDARYKDGSRLTNDQVLGMLIAVLFAGQHTSSITSTWTGLLAMANKDRVFPALLEEQRNMMKKHDGKIDFDVLAEMDELHFAIKEALRMHPPLIMLLRMCHKPFKVTTTKGKDYVIPKGHIVATSPAFAHRMNDVFKDADVYNPNRFKAPTAEDKKAFASFIGFGGGRHGCMGETFAYMQIKTIWSVLLRNFDFELVGDVPEPDYEGMVVGPKGPCKVKYTRRKLA